MKKNGKMNGVKLMVAVLVTGIVCGNGRSVYAATNTENTLVVEEDKLHYQQSIEHALLPWSGNITYKLDGKTIEETMLDGVDGTLEIEIHLEENPLYEEMDVYDGEPIEVTVNVDADSCEEIEAEGAEITDDGETKQITYTLTPGEEIDLHITAEVSDFASGDMAIAGFDIAEQFAREVGQEVVEEKISCWQRVKKFFENIF